MKIKSITINKYKAFTKAEPIPINGKNIFIYGENGSGKSSFYYALKDFFQSSVENINFRLLRNYYLKDGKKDCSVEVKFDNKKVFRVDESSKTTVDYRIADANRLKSFITYRHLIKVYNIPPHKDEIDVFDLVINGVLKHFKSNLITGPYELGELYQSVLQESKKTTGKGGDYYFKRDKAKSVAEKAKLFNNAFNTLFLNSSTEYLGTDINYYLKKIYPELEVQFIRQTITVNGKDGSISGGKLLLEIDENGKSIKSNKPHLSLNEAKLSAIAISIFFAAVKKQHPFSIDIKPLFLDDILVGLDNENRIKILDILLEKDIPEKDKVFSKFQIFISTYDRHWYEVAKIRLKDNWSFIEFYKGEDGPEIITNDKSNLEKAKAYLNCKKYPIAAHLLRKESETILKELLPFTHQIEIDNNRDIIKTPSLDQLIENLRKYYNELEVEPPESLIENLSLYRKILFNPMSHSDIESPVYKSDLENAFQVLDKLRQVKLPERTVIFDKNEEFHIELPEIDYQATIILAQNVYKVSYDSNSKFSPIKFYFKHWIREGVEFAEDKGTPPKSINNVDKLDKIKKSPFDLNKIVNALNKTFKDKDINNIDVEYLMKSIYRINDSVFDFLDKESLITG